jgi:hypothetical protein
MEKKQSERQKYWQVVIAILQQMLVDLTAQLDKTQRLLRQLLAAKSGSRSEQISADQLALFAQELGIDTATTAEQESKGEDRDPDPPPASTDGEKKPRGRQALPRHLKRERIVHDLAEPDKRCSDCQQALRISGKKSASATNISRRRCW